MWRRAAELQAAAEHEAQQSRVVQRVDPGELSLEHVTEAARGAGINAEFVHLALAEQRLPDATDLGHHTWKARWLQRIVRGPHFIERQRVIGADPTAVIAAFRRVAASAAYGLTPESAVGADPVRDGVLVYRLDSSTTFGSTMNFADARVLLVSVRPHEGGTSLRIRVPLFRRGVNLVLGGVSGSLFGAGGVALGGTIASAVGASALLLAAPAAAAGAGVGIVAFRALYRGAIRQGEKSVDRFLQTVAMEATSADPAHDHRLPPT